MECLNTGFITARYVNMEKYRSKLDIVNNVATDCCIYGEYGDSFSKPLNDFFKQFTKSMSENLIWAKLDLKLTEFRDCKNIHRETNIQARLTEQVFVQNNRLWTGLGYYTPH